MWNLPQDLSKSKVLKARFTLVGDICVYPPRKKTARGDKEEPVDMRGKLSSEHIKLNKAPSLQERTTYPSV